MRARVAALAVLVASAIDIAAAFPRGLPSSAFVAHGAATRHERVLDDATLDRLVPPLLERQAAQ